MKRQSTILLFVLACAAMLLTSCETALTPQKGQKVRFSVSSKNGVKTKTQYSGELDENKYERINWQVNDKVRIVSSDKSKVSTPAGDDSYDYTISAVFPPRGRYSDASLSDTPGTNGLTWSGSEVQEVAFYGSYPLVDYGFPPEGSKAPIFKNMSISDSPSLSWNGNTGSPDMSHAYMLAAPARYNGDNGKIHLDFYPVFNAFEIDLASQDGSIALKKLQLISTSSNLAGTFLFDGSDNAGGSNWTSDGPVLGGIKTTGTVFSKTITVDLSGKTITSSSDGHVHFTILALPGELTDITLAVTYVDPQDATKEKTRKLKLQKNGRFISFPAFGKARINGLALDAGSRWKLTIQTEVQDWTFYSKELSSLDQINVAPIEIGQPATVKVTGAIQTTAEWRSAHGGSSNDEIEANGYARYYQVRTLNWNLPVDKQFIEMSFTPTAPIGGYWEMIPEFLGTNSDKHFSFKVKIQGVSDWEDQEAPHGQILSSKKVFIRIYPKDYAQDDINVYEMILKCYFSPNASFDPTYSADSELQDIHGDGRFSYWRFRLDKATGSGTYTPGSPEHDSDKL